MKKVLLLSAVVAMSAAAVNAIEPQVLENVSINKLSPDGNLAVSDMNGVVTIFDFANDKTYEYGMDEETYISYTTGLGNAISSTGIIVGGKGDENPAYWENGEWKMLPVSEVNGVYGVNGISADGSVMCGIVPSTTTGATTILPAIWTRNADGSYSDYKILPHPSKDFSGRDPQHITAVCISNDGKTIAGQIQDYSGMIPQPIVYRMNDKNEWEYELIHPEMINVSNVEFPEWSPEPYRPEPEDFMTPENLAAYEEAYQTYIQNGYKPDLMPYPSEYMTPEEIAAFEEAAAIYNEWLEKDNAIGDIVWSLPDEGAAMFVYNNVALSGNGKYYGTTAQFIIDGEYKYMPIIFDLETGDFTKHSTDKDISITFVADNGNALAGTVMDFFSISPMQAYALKSGEDTFVPLIDFLAYSPVTVDWMKKNMSHDGVATGEYDEEGSLILEDNYMITGMPTANADMSVIATSTSSDLWDIDNWEKPAAYSYLLTPGLNPTGIALPVGGANLAIAIVDGAIMLNGDAASVAVYDLNGRLVMNVANPGAKVETTLASGFYIVKAVAANGEAVTVKAAL